MEDNVDGFVGIQQLNYYKNHQSQQHICPIWSHDVTNADQMRF